MILIINNSLKKEDLVLEEIKNKAKIFYDNKILVFTRIYKKELQEIHNGYIIELNNEYFILYDVISNSRILHFYTEFLNNNAFLETSRKKASEINIPENLFNNSKNIQGESIDKS